MALLDRAFGALTQLGYSPAQATGILGNLKVESGLNPAAVGDNGTSYGLAQWHNDRWTGLKNYAASHGMSQADPVAQIQYLDWELKNREPRAYKALQSAQTPQEAAAAFLHFERPQGYSATNPLASLGSAKRVAAATELFNTVGGQQPIPGSAPTVPAGLVSPAAMAPEAPMGVADASTDTTPVELPQQKQTDIRGLLASLMQQEQEAQQFALPQAKAIDAPAMPRARGLAFKQLTVKTPKFARG